MYSPRNSFKLWSWEVTGVLVSSDRVAASFVGLTLVLSIRKCWILGILSLLLLFYGLLPRERKLSSRVLRVVCTGLGILLLVFVSLLLYGLVEVRAPAYVIVLLALLLAPTTALTFYGLGVEVPRVESFLGSRAVACIRVATIIVVMVTLGLGFIVSYAVIITGRPSSLAELHEVGPYSMKLPGWAIASISMGLGVFLLVLGIGCMVRFKSIISRLQGFPRPDWAPGSKIGQLVVLGFGALLVGVSPFIYFESGVLLAAGLVLALGVYFILLIVDSVALKIAYEELKHLLTEVVMKR